MATTTAQSIQGFYQNILRRIGPPADVAFWTGVVDVQGVPLSQVENDFVTSPEAMAFVSPIVEIYQTYLGRAPDSAGFNAWVNALHGGMSLSAVENDFANSAESQAFYGGSISTPADSAFVTKLYQTVLNRAPTPAEVTAILGVTTNRATLLTDFLQSPEAGVTLTNASNQFLTSIGSGNTDPYGVSLFSGGSTVSNVFTLTPGADIIPNGLVGSNGTTNSGNVVINGSVDFGTQANSTLNASDNLNGGNGANTMNVTYVGGAGDATNGALISNVQTFNARNAIASGAGFVTLDATNVPGLTAFNSNLGTGDVEVDNLPAGASAGIIGNGSVENGELDVGYVAAATAATINFSGGTGNATLTPAAGPFVDVFDAPGVTSTTVNSTGGVNTIEELDLFGTATKTLTVDAATNLKTLDGVFSPALTTITASGAATSVNLGSLAGDPVKTIDASGLTAGGISVKDVGPTLTTFTGGVGNDSLVFAPGGITGTQTLDGGTGTNTLGIEDTGDLAVTAPAVYTGVNASTNFQTLELAGTATTTLDQSLVNATFTTVQFHNAGLAPGVVSNATTATHYSIVAAGGVQLNAAVGQTVLNASLDGSATAAATAGFINETGAQTFNLASNGSFTAPNTVAPPDSFGLPDNTLFTISGAQPLSTGGILNQGLLLPLIGETVNDTMTAKLTLDNSAGNGPVNFTTGTGGSSITAATGAGIINNFTLGTGADKLSFLGGSSQIVAGVDTATAFDATKDSFHLPFLPTAVDPFSGGGTGTLLTDLNAAINAADPAGLAADHVGSVTITSGTDAGTYLASTAGGVAGHLVAADTAVNLVGLTGTLGTSNFA
jgi:Domain of unknown function (DUF4214)